MQNDTLAAVDIAKEVFEVGVSDRPGHVARRRRVARYEFLEFFAQLPPATVVMEACGSAHYWARRIEELGHVVVLLQASPLRPVSTIGSPVRGFHHGRERSERSDEEAADTFAVRPSPPRFSRSSHASRERYELTTTLLP